jgi:hypothetical protein
MKKLEKDKAELLRKIKVMEEEQEALKATQGKMKKLEEERD